jgi:pilus assembly protein Flp/PilA
MNPIDGFPGHASRLGKPRTSSIGIPHKGQGFIEYALIISFVAIVVLIILLLLGPAIGNMYSNIISTI